MPTFSIWICKGCGKHGQALEGDERAYVCASCNVCNRVERHDHFDCPGFACNEQIRKAKPRTRGGHRRRRAQWTLAAVGAYVIVALSVYQWRHPDLTEIQRFWAFFDAMLWR